MVSWSHRLLVRVHHTIDNTNYVACIIYDHTYDVLLILDIILYYLCYGFKQSGEKEREVK